MLHSRSTSGAIGSRDGYRSDRDPSANLDLLLREQLRPIEDDRDAGGSHAASLIGSGCNRFGDATATFGASTRLRDQKPLAIGSDSVPIVDGMIDGQARVRPQCEE
jgi:hypothetical protein